MWITDQRILSISIEKDGIGLHGDYQTLISYGSDKKEVNHELGTV